MTIAGDFDGTIVEHRYPKICNEITLAKQPQKMIIKGNNKLSRKNVRAESDVN